MPQNCKEQAPLEDIEDAHLTELLKHKLSAVPVHHIPNLSLSDVIHNTPRALHLSNIPPDIQLAFFLRNRGLIDSYARQPIKDKAQQSLDITRAVWYYRLDESHQFQRYHDTTRWNIALFIALLTDTAATSPPATALPASKRFRSTSHLKDTYIRPSARHFMKVYLAAVLEQHNEPSVFDKRDRFVRLWKNSIYDVFQVVRSGQKKLLKNEMKRLTKEWEYELDDRIRRMGRDEYNARVAKFVGSLIPGRKDQALPSALYPPTVPATPPLSGEAKHQMSLDIKAEEEEIEQKRGCPGAKNDLLDALRAPPDDLGERKKMSTDDTTTVTDIWYSISAVQKIRPRDILPMLMHLFP